MPSGSYTKTTWSSSVAITAKRMNHLETQYEEIEYLVNNHQHDTSHYKKTESDSKFYHAENMGGNSSADADLLDGQHVSALIGTGLPAGAILMWSGSDGNIPYGWAVCNGQIVNGYQTPDLRDRFVIGAGGSLSPGATGGSTTITPSATLSAGGHSLTVDEIPAHTHAYADKYVTGSVSRYCVTNTSKAGTETSRSTTTAATGSGAAHSHPGNISFSQNSNLPPYYVLYFIMKVI